MSIKLGGSKIPLTSSLLRYFEKFKFSITVLPSLVLGLKMRIERECIQRGFPGGTSGEEPAYQCRRPKRCRFDTWVGKIPWRRTRQPTPVFLPGKSHAQRSLADYNPWGHKQLDTTEVTSHTSAHCAYKVPCTQGIKTALSRR